MFKKMFITLIFVCSILIIQEINTTNNDNYNIVFLDNSLTKSKNMSFSYSDFDFDPKVNAYVLYKSHYNSIVNENKDSYLKNGGIVIINNDSGVRNTNNKLTSVYNDNENNISNYHYFIYNNGDENVVSNIIVNYAIPCEENDLSLNINDIDKETFVKDIIVSTKSSRGSPVITPTPGPDTGGDNNTTINPVDTSGQMIAYALCNGYVYLQSTSILIGTYTIYTQVYGVAKVTDNSGTTRGLYDVSSKFTIDAEPSYRVKDYRVRMSNYNTILDSSYINSNTSTTINLGGTLGFEGAVISGNMNSGTSYTYSADSQEILNDLPAGGNKYWKSTVVSPQSNASYALHPAIRIVNSDDTISTYEYSRVESITYLSVEGYSYNMQSNDRKELAICWNSYGKLNDYIYTG